MGSFVHRRQPDLSGQRQSAFVRPDRQEVVPQANATAGHDIVQRAVPGLASGSAADPLGGSRAAPEVVAALRRRQGQGVALDAAAGQAMGDQLGTDLSGVRIHADAESNRITRSVQATAFTHGKDVYFSDGAYAPNSAPGKRLLAHELAHVAQAERAVDGSVGAPVIGRADDPAEVEADHVAEHVVSAVSTSSPGADSVECSVDGSVIHRSLTKTLEHAGTRAKKSAKKKYKQLVGSAPAVAPAAVVAAPATAWAPAAPSPAAPRPAARPTRQTPKAKPVVAFTGPVPAVGDAPVPKRKPKIAAPAVDTAAAAVAAAAAADAKAQRAARRAERAQKAADKLAKSAQRIAKRQPPHLAPYAILEALAKASAPTPKPPAAAAADATTPAAPAPAAPAPMSTPAPLAASASASAAPLPVAMDEPQIEAKQDTAPADEAAPLDAGSYAVGALAADHFSPPTAHIEAKPVPVDEPAPFRMEQPEGYAQPGSINLPEDDDTDTTAEPGQFRMEQPEGYAQPGSINLPEDDDTKTTAEPTQFRMEQPEGYAQPGSIDIPEDARTADDDWDGVLPALAPGADTKAEPAPSEAAGQPAAKPGTSRPHRAFQVNDLPMSFANETKDGNQKMSGPIGDETRKVAAAHYVMQQLKVLKNVDAAVMAQVSAALGAQLLDSFLQYKDKAPSELLSALTAYHAGQLDRLRRQELDVSEDGTVHMTTPTGARKAYPLDYAKNPILHDRKVKYDKGADKQARTRVDFRGGLLYRSETNSKPGKVDTGDSVTFLSGVGFEIFVVDAKNNIHMASHKIGKYHHSSLLAGAPISMGGEMKVVDGKIQYMSNKSGHYMPSMESFIQFLNFLEKDGIDLDFPVYSFAGSLNGTAKELLDGTIGNQAKPKNKPVDSIKTSVVLQSFIAEFDEVTLTEALHDEGWHRMGKDVVDEKDEPVPLQDVRRGLKRQLAKKRGSNPKDTRARQKIETKERAAKPADVWWM